MFSSRQNERWLVVHFRSFGSSRLVGGSPTMSSVHALLRSHVIHLRRRSIFCFCANHLRACHRHIGLVLSSISHCFIIIILLRALHPSFLFGVRIGLDFLGRWRTGRSQQFGLAFSFHYLGKHSFGFLVRQDTVMDTPVGNRNTHVKRLERCRQNYHSGGSYHSWAMRESGRWRNKVS